MDSTLSVTSSCGEANRTNGLTFSKNPLPTGLEGFVDNTCGDDVWFKEAHSQRADHDNSQEQACPRPERCANKPVPDNDFWELNASVDTERQSAIVNNNIYSTSFPVVYEQERLVSDACSEEVFENRVAPETDNSEDSAGSTHSFSPNYLSPLLSPQLKPSSFPSHELFKRPYSVPVLHVGDEQRMQTCNESIARNSVSAYNTSNRSQKESKDDNVGLSGLSPSYDKRYEDLGLSARKSKCIQPIGSKQNVSSGYSRTGLGSPLLFHVENADGNDNSPKGTQESILEDFRVSSSSLQRVHSDELTADISNITLQREEQSKSLNDISMPSYSPFESPSLRTPVVEESEFSGGFYDDSQQKFLGFANFHSMVKDSLFRSSSLSALERNGYSAASAPSSFKRDGPISHCLTSQRRRPFLEAGYSGERHSSSSYEDVLSAFRALDCGGYAGDTKDIQTWSSNGSQYSSPQLISSPVRVESKDTRVNYNSSDYSPGPFRCLNSESPSRTILIKNIPPGVDDSELRSLLERFGPLRDLGAQQRSKGGRGAIQATYFDLRHAREAVNSLPKLMFHGRSLEVRFILSNDAFLNVNEPMKKTVHSTNTASQFNNGTLVVFNLDPSITADELRKVFGAYGDIKEIRESPHKRHHKFIEFYDVRDAERALRKLNKTEIGGKKIKIEISRPGGVRSHLVMNDSLFASSSYPSCNYSSNFVEEDSSSESFSGLFPYSDSYEMGEFSAPFNSLVPEVVGSLERTSPRTCAYNTCRNISSPVSRSYGFSSKDILGQSPRTTSNPLLRTSDSPIRTPGEGSIFDSHFGDSVSSGIFSSRNLSDERSKFVLHVEKVRCGEDTRTALMIRNIPNKYNQRMLLATLEENHRGKFDFFYLPIDFKNRCNVGYAFINFRHPQFIIPFYFEFHGRRWGRFNSEKVCEITYARIQGRNNLIAHFQNSSIMNEDPKCRPIIFGENGERLEFPIGPHVRTRRGPNSREVSVTREIVLDENVAH